MASSPIPLTVSDPITAALTAAMGLGTGVVQISSDTRGPAVGEGSERDLREVECAGIGIFRSRAGADCEGGRVGWPKSQRIAERQKESVNDN